MAKKYLKYFVTRDNQAIPYGLIEYVERFPKEKHLLNTMSIYSWHLYEMFQGGFYCNWPNTEFKRYFIQAEPIILEQSTIKDNSVYDFFGILFLNANDQKIILEVDGESQTIDVTPGLLLISSHKNETYKFIGDRIVAVKFKISSHGNEENWIPF